MEIVSGASCLRVSFLADSPDVFLLVGELYEDPPLIGRLPAGRLLDTASNPRAANYLVCSPTNCTDVYQVALPSSALLGIYVENHGQAAASAIALYSAYTKNNPGTILTRVRMKHIKLHSKGHGGMTHEKVNTRNMPVAQIC